MDFDDTEGNYEQNAEKNILYGDTRSAKSELRCATSFPELQKHYENKQFIYELLRNHCRQSTIHEFC